MADDAFEYNSYLIFKVSNQKFAFDVMYVKEVLLKVETLQLPVDVEFVKGFVGYKDMFIPLINISQKLGINANNQNTKKYIVAKIEQDDDSQHAIVEVDSIIGVKNIKVIEIKKVSNISEKLKKYTSGLFYDDDIPVTTLKTDMLLSSEDIMKLHTIGSDL